MEPGIYIAGRPIKNKLELHVTHQFLVLVPHKEEVLSGIAKKYNGIRYLLLGAYPTKGFLRAEKFAPSDESQLKQYIDSSGKGGAQLESVEVLSCFIDADTPISSMYRAFAKYKMYEGKKEEIKYPVVSL